MEIQQDATKLKDICNIKGETSLKVLIVYDQGKLVYGNTNANEQEIVQYTNIVKANKSLSTIEA